MSNIAYQRLDDLEKRPLPKTFNEIKIKFMNPVLGNEDKEVDNEIKDEQDEDEENMENQEDIVVNPVERNIKIVDKRKNNTLNRLEILKRLQDKSIIRVIDNKEDDKVNLVKEVIEEQKEEIPVMIEEKDEEEKEEEKEEQEKEKEEEKKEQEKEKEEEKEEQEKEKEEEKVGKKIKLKIKKKGLTISNEIDLTTAAINGQKVLDRLPKEREKVIVRAPTYYMNNRKLFIQKLKNLLKYYEEEITKNEEEISCDRNVSGQFELLTHQKVVRDYLNLYTPYRGLLLYHGLGSGKTCTSIAISEGMKTDKRIFILTPASLKMNYFSEMKKCGDDLYKKEQYWEFVSIVGNPDYVGILSRALNIPTEHITKNKGAWLVNIEKEGNYSELDSQSQKQLDEQLNVMIRSKYTDINYNGLNKRKMEDLTGNYSRNPFDNSVVVIDEAHNFVSLIVNKIKDKNSIAYKLYEYLLSANNVKIVLLTGTPIINYPNEIGVLYNVLRGYIKTWSIPISWDKREKLDKDVLLKIIDEGNLKNYDYIDYSKNTLTITKNPFGFINVKKRGILKGTRRVKPQNDNNKTRKMNGGNDIFDKYNGVKLDESGNMSDDVFQEQILKILRKNGIKVIDKDIEIINNKALPDDKEKFISTFVNNETLDTQNMNLFQRRILGLTSYFRSAQEGLLPRLEKTENNDMYHLIKCEMSSHQFGKYEKIRKEEADKENKSRKNMIMNKRKQGDASDLYNVSSNYRVFSRVACNFVFPEGIERPYKERINKDLDEEDIDIENKEQIETLEEVIEEKTDDNYGKRIENVLEELNANKEDSNEKEYLSKESLSMHSPKFLKVLENIQDEENIGLHLLYSHFRTLEGIGILKLILLGNGFAEFKLKKENNDWVIEEKEEDKGKPRFVLYTGTEGAEIKEIIRNVYNSNWELVPNSIVEQMQKINSNNNYGEIIKLMMITASGAEGINLRNTRFVHIVEPYWHMVRVEQVIGRARRICSHQDLPEELRTVKVFLYVSVLTEHQKTSNEHKELQIRDISKIDRKSVITTDESLYELASQKQKINNEILRSIKETSVDCSLYSKNVKDSDEKYVCYGFGKVESNQFSSYPTLEEDKQYKEGLDTKVDVFKGVRIKDPKTGNEYILNRKTNDVYTYESYLRWKENNNNELDYKGKFINGVIVE